MNANKRQYERKLFLSAKNAKDAKVLKQKLVFLCVLCVFRGPKFGFLFAFISVHLRTYAFPL